MKFIRCYRVSRLGEVHGDDVIMTTYNDDREMTIATDNSPTHVWSVVSHAILDRRYLDSTRLQLLIQS